MSTASEIVRKMAETGLVPVFFHKDLAVCKNVIKASYDGGIRVFELTNRGKNALEIFEALNRYTNSFEDLVLGVGTIFSKEDAERFHRAGAQFVVSPVLIPEIGAYCDKNGLLWIPGCGTVSEVYQANVLGAKVVKVFPGNVLGPPFVKAVKAVLPGLPLMPTGGVLPTSENLTSWFRAGVHCVGMGSQLFTKDRILQGASTQLSSTIAETLSLVHQIRSDLEG